MKPVVGYQQVNDLMQMNLHAFQTGQTPSDLLAEYGVNGDDVMAGYLASGLSSEDVAYAMGGLLLGLQIAGLPEVERANR